MQRPDIYLRTTDLGGASPREAEILAFGLCNLRLQRAADTKSRIEALHQNHVLWSALVRDLASDGNQLPDALKRALIDLGFWSMRYCTAAATSDLPVAPLISVNSNILDGLKAQTEGRGLATPPARDAKPPSETVPPCVPAPSLAPPSAKHASEAAMTPSGFSGSA